MAFVMIHYHCNHLQVGFCNEAWHLVVWRRAAQVLEVLKLLAPQDEARMHEVWQLVGARKHASKVGVMS